MKIQIEKDALNTGIQTVQNIVSSRTTLPILSNILLETTKNNTLKFYATDLDVGISCEIPVDIIEEGSITIQAKRFSDIVKELPNEKIMINVSKNNKIDIEGQHCRFKVSGLSKDEFPKFPDLEDSFTVKLNQSILKKLLKLTVISVSHPNSEEGPNVLNGVLIDIQDNLITIVATDGNRLSKSEIEIQQTFSEDRRVILPLKAIAELQKNLSDSSKDELSMIVSKNQVLFKTENVFIVTRLMEGEFPEYKQVIPKNIVSQKIKVNKNAFSGALRRSTILGTPDFEVVKFELFKDKLVIFRNTPDIGESREEVFIEYKGSELSLGCNPNYFYDLLKNLDIEDEDIVLDFYGEKKPIVIKIDKIKHTYLVMPVLFEE